MLGKNKYEKRSHFSQRGFREAVKFFAKDLRTYS